MHEFEFSVRSSNCKGNQTFYVFTFDKEIQTKNDCSIFNYKTTFSARMSWSCSFL